ncbi:hypothetical protein DES53_10555 [Roseimicrobium gellanilyticum]|uniref:Uncharacterized protein n=1 Tax=Roseimicrobium gellanilyticum TaxID=748857 RepID=A0A366HM55_9BACT|nr:hypothetical protein DES53_10555 [Roseimicrobium gellanilyticum]
MLGVLCVYALAYFTFRVLGPVSADYSIPFGSPPPAAATDPLPGAADSGDHIFCVLSNISPPSMRVYPTTSGGRFMVLFFQPALQIEVSVRRALYEVR